MIQSVCFPLHYVIDFPCYELLHMALDWFSLVSSYIKSLLVCVTLIYSLLWCLGTIKDNVMAFNDRKCAQINNKTSQCSFNITDDQKPF